MRLSLSIQRGVVSVSMQAVPAVYTLVHLIDNCDWSSCAQHSTAIGCAAQNIMSYGAHAHSCLRMRDNNSQS